MSIYDILEDIYDHNPYGSPYDARLACCSEEADLSPAPLRDPENLSYLAPQRQTSRDDFPRTLPDYTAGFT